MDKFKKIYEENTILDNLFLQKYNHDDLVRKNKLELLVEIGELANETRCFKYWSQKKVNQELMELEYADCLIMTLCFFNYLKISLDEEFPFLEKKYDIIDTLANLYILASSFYIKEEKLTIKKIFVLLIQLGHDLGMTDDEIINVTLIKIKEDEKRLLNA